MAIPAIVTKILEKGMSNPDSLKNALQIKETVKEGSSFKDSGFPKHDTSIADNKIGDWANDKKIDDRIRKDDGLDDTIPRHRKDYPELGDWSKNNDSRHDDGSLIEKVNPEEKGKIEKHVQLDDSNEPQLDFPLEHSKSDLLPKNGGEWSGEPGNSDWVPDDDTVPGDRNGTNPDNKTWKDIKEEYGFDKIPFKDGEPDFSEVSKGQVEIDDFTDDRDSNFTQADEALAKQKGCTPEEVAKWRRDNGYTWHECKDCKTMQKVPTEVHGNVSHSGGVSEYKSNKGNTSRNDGQ